MASTEDFSTVQVLYQLSWDHGKLEHPHMIDVQYPSNQDGLRLRDVKKRLTTLRGDGIGQLFSWSYKRNYRSTFIWNDLCDDDVIHPLRGSGEYLLKASELMDTFASKPAEPDVTKYQIERKQEFLGTMSSEKVVMKENLHSGADGLSSSDREDESKKLLPSPLAVEQETIDVEKSDFCLSSSDNEISPRPTMAGGNTKPVKDQGLVQGLQTSTDSSLPSPTELPFSPGSAKRMWKREIRKSLFRTTSRNVTITVSPAETNATLHAELPAPITGQEDALLWRHGRSKSVTPSNLHELKEEEETEQHSTSQLIRSLWARWTGGSSKGKRSISPQTKSHPRSRTKSPGTEKSRSPHIQQSRHENRQFTTAESKSSDDSVSLQEDHSHVTIIPEPPASVTDITNPNSELEANIAAIKTVANPEPQFPQRQELKKEKVVLSLEIPTMQVDVPDSPTSDTQGGPPESEIDTPKPAIARVKTSHGLPKVKTTASPRRLPPGFHKGTNDTKPVQTPKRNNLRSYSTPLASPPPLMRSLSRDAMRSLSARGASITPASSPESKDSVTSTPSPETPLVKKCINFRERDDRSLQPGLSNIDWEKALQEAVTNDTKPVQTPKRNNLRNYSTPLASPPPLIRSLSRDASITPASSPESKDSVTSTPSPETPPVKKCINFRERDDRPLQPGLSNIDWEKALQEAVTNCLPPPNFRDILQECSTCGRTFKPDSLQVHKRGCHPPQYSRAFSARASPHIVRSRAA